MSRSCHHGVRLISSCHVHDVFQSSRMSWSSKIMQLGTVESSHRFGRVAPRELVEVGVLLVVLDLLARRLVDVTTRPR